MQEGGQYRFTMPQKLALRRQRPPPQGFPKDSNLDFEVRVRKIVRGGAAMMQQQAQQQQQRRSRSKRLSRRRRSGAFVLPPPPAAG